VIDDNGVLRVASIHVVYSLKAGDEQKAEAEQVHSSHADYCPMANTVKNCVRITTELTFE
jgi:uncharacterized OsmC-like protein